MTTSVAEAGEVIVEGEHLGRIEGFRFVPDATEGQADQKAVLTAALRALRENLPARLQAFTSAPDGELVFDSQLRVCWGGGPVARLLPSGDVLAPKVEALPSDLLDGPAREDVRKRAAAWVETRIRLGLSELMDARAIAELPAGARGIIFQLCENLGVLPRRPIEQQLAELGDEDRRALARLGVRMGVYSLYFPSMLKPVPIRLRAGLWMVAHGRDTIPPLPAEGRTSTDLPRDAERDFYAAIGYLPLGGHAIRADMVERLAAMARHAVRESREAARRAQQDKKAASPGPAAAGEPAPSTDEITEWAIVAAAFGEAEAQPPMAETQPAPAPAQPAAEDTTAATPTEPVAETAPAESEAETAEPGAAKAAPESAETGSQAGTQADAQQAAMPETPKKAEPAPLPPGHFRATPQMMSLVGCSEPEMADVLRALGYRVLPPTEEGGPHSFSVKPRFLREREEQRERQRQQQRQYREQRRRERPDRPNERQFFADSPGRDGPRRDNAKHQGPRPDNVKGGARDDRRDERPRGPRPPRRDAGGPALRLYATTEKKGDNTADSPFAKLLELKLGGKK
jgi:ATP-dependent RNA helicase SUPV3L1/SUV3